MKRIALSLLIAGAHVLPLDGYGELAAFFDGFLLPAPGA